MKCKLLVAEDELIERKVLCRTLQKYLGDLICLYEAKNGTCLLYTSARQAISVRAMDYLLKPYNEQELVFAVEDAIRQVSVPLPAHPAQPPAPEQPVRREEDEDMRRCV